MKLIIASNNQHKVREIKEILHDYFTDMHTLKEAGISIEVEETGTTFEENAILKAEGVLDAAIGYDAAIADDSGLVVDALNGAPGIYSARYAGEGHNDDDNNQKLMEDTKDVPWEKRTCRFTAAVALARKGRKTITSTGSVEGILLTEPHGTNGFGYDPYFYYEPAGKAFAELSAEEKNSVSHRKLALEGLKTFLANEA